LGRRQRGFAQTEVLDLLVPPLNPANATPAITRQVATVFVNNCDPRKVSFSHLGRKFVRRSAPTKMIAYRTPEIAETISGRVRLTA
jgi:hypothetical protein